MVLHCRLGVDFGRATAVTVGRTVAVKQAAGVGRRRQGDHLTSQLEGGKIFVSNFKHAQAHYGFVFNFISRYAPHPPTKMARPPLSIIIPSASNSCVTDFGKLESSVESDDPILTKRIRRVRFEATGLPLVLCLALML